MQCSPEIRARAKATLLLRKRREASVVSYVNPDPVEWIQTHFYIPELNGPMQLYPFHRAGLREALSKNSDGLYNYSTIVWSAIKKSAKSSIAAAVALWMAWQTPWATIKVIANDLKQADSRVFYYINRCLTLNKKMGAQVKSVHYKITLPNHATIEAIPIDPKGEAGGNDDLVVYSEIWGWRYDVAKQMWTETTLSPLKYGRSLRWCETYAGFQGESPILEELYSRGVEHGECINPEYEFYRLNRLLVIWNTRPTTPWQTPEYYSQEASDLLDTEFDRVHRNKWASPTEAFIPIEWWDACRQVTLPASDPMEPWIIALDAAVEGDCFGLVALTRKNGISVTRHIRKWTPPKGGKIMFFAPAGTPPEQDTSPAGEIRRIVSRHSVISICYDPYQLHSFCSQLREELIVYFEDFPQGPRRLLADKALLDAIRERNIWHDGNTDLREHLMNANKQLGTGDLDKLRIVKRRENMKIDLAVCLSMANYSAIRMNIG